MDRKSSSRSEASTTLALFGLTLILAVGSAYTCFADPFFRAMMALAQQSDLLASRYFGEVAPERIFADAWQGMQSAIPFRVELAESENQPTTQPRDRDWGLTLSEQDSAMEIVNIAEHSPFNGFLLPEDKITGVDSLRNEKIVHFVEYLDKREQGETKIYFLREGRSDSVTIQVSLDEESDIAKFAVEDSIGYLKVSLPKFKDLSEQIAQMKQAAVIGMIIDLRESKGSNYEEAGKLAETIIAAIANRPVVVLIDASTRGASEEIARRIGDNGTAVLMGAPTAGIYAAVDEIELRTGGKLLVSANERISRDLVDEFDSVKVPGPPANAILPAITCKNFRMSPLLFELLHGGYILDFVTKSRYNAVPTVAAEDSLLTDFVIYLGHRNFRYDPLGHILSEMSLNEMDADMTPVYVHMRQTHRAIGEADLTEYRDEIVRNLLRTIHRVKVGGEPSILVQARTDDVCLAEAIKYLKGAAR